MLYVVPVAVDLEGNPTYTLVRWKVLFTHDFMLTFKISFIKIINPHNLSYGDMSFKCFAIFTITLSGITAIIGQLKVEDHR